MIPKVEVITYDDTMKNQRCIQIKRKSYVTVNYDAKFIDYNSDLDKPLSNYTLVPEINLKFVIEMEYLADDASLMYAVLKQIWQSHPEILDEVAAILNANKQGTNPCEEIQPYYGSWSWNFGKVSWTPSKKSDPKPSFHSMKASSEYTSDQFNSFSTFASTSAKLAKESWKLPGMSEVVKHPIHRSDWKLRDAIVDLNDTYRWTREKIADWLETLDIDLTFKTEVENEQD